MPDQLPPPGPDLDAIVHAKVMNLPLRRMCTDVELVWKHGVVELRECVMDIAKPEQCRHLDRGGDWSDCQFGESEEMPPYSTNDATSLLVLYRMIELAKKAGEPHKHLAAIFHTGIGWAAYSLLGDPIHQTNDETLAAAICYAGIDAARIMKGESHDA